MNASKQLNEMDLDLIFQALSASTRRTMLKHLSKGPALVKELAAPHDMTLPAISRHLKILEKANLIQRNISGRNHYCSLNHETIKKANDWLMTYSKYWEGSLENLAILSEKKKPMKRRNAKK